MEMEKEGLYNSLFLSSQVFEPSELEKGMLTNKDNEIRTADVPERFQVRCEKLYIVPLVADMVYLFNTCWQSII